MFKAYVRDPKLDQHKLGLQSAVCERTKFIDADGKEIKEGLSSPLFKPGAPIELTSNLLEEKKDMRRLILQIKLLKP